MTEAPGPSICTSVLINSGEPKSIVPCSDASEPMVITMRRLCQLVAQRAGTGVIQIDYGEIGGRNALLERFDSRSARPARADYIYACNSKSLGGNPRSRATVVRRRHVSTNLTKNQTNTSALI